MPVKILHLLPTVLLAAALLTHAAEKPKSAPAPRTIR
jgi:hypothetical protein